MASGRCAPHQQVEHMAAPTSSAEHIQIPLAKGEPFSNRASFVKLIWFTQIAALGVTVLFAVSICCRMIWYEASVLQCPQRAPTIN